MSKPKVVIGMSGGVDSSVAAWLLKEQGYQVTGLFMKNWQEDDTEQYCSSRQDFLDAVSVADRIGIDIEAVNFAEEYKDRVFSYFLQEYEAGRTPNPDILCNTEIKFKAFLDHALSLGAEKIATGHYAGVRQTKEGFELLKARDLSKDQSYFLHRLTQEQLSKAIFPLQNLLKTDVRQLAQKIGLHNYAKKDSTGICFIGERPFREFLNRYLPSKPGPIFDDTGKQLGEHMGLAFYTLGQRKGIGIGGSKNGSGEPWFVARKDMASNSLYVVQGHEHPWLKTATVHSQQSHWIAGNPPLENVSLAAKTRYRQQDAACHLKQQDTLSFTLQFESAQWAVTPGQSAVVYADNICLGGGIITA